MLLRTVMTSCFFYHFVLLFSDIFTDLKWTRVTAPGVLPGRNVSSKMKNTVWQQVRGGGGVTHKLYIIYIYFKFPIMYYMLFLFYSVYKHTFTDQPEYFWSLRKLV